MFDAKQIAKEIVGKGEKPGGGGDLEGLAQELIDAVKSGDAKGVADAFQACFEACEMEPHEEAGEPPAE